MNKSKFLKKSLALLLALMLVFAMIPLSASAATVSGVWVNDTMVTPSGTTYNYSMVQPAPGTSVTVAVRVQNGVGDVRFMDANGIYNQATTNSGENTFTYDIDDPQEGAYEFAVFASATATEPDETYTLNLSWVEPDTDNGVANVTVDGCYNVSREEDAFTVVLPYGEDEGEVLVTTTNANATVYLSTGTAATPVTTNVWSLGTIALNATTNFSVVAQNSDQRASYSVTLVEPKPFASFSVEGERRESQIERVTEDPKFQVSSSAHPHVEVYLPYDEQMESDGSYYFTPVFETNYNVTVSAYEGYSLSGDKVEFVSGETYNLKDFAYDASTSMTAAGDLTSKVMILNVTYSEGASEDWYLTFHVPATDPVAAIKELRVGNYVAEIDGTNITLNLPASQRVVNDITLETTSSVAIVNTTIDNTTNTNTLPSVNLATNTYILQVTAAGTEVGATAKEVVDYTLTINTVAEQAPKMETMDLQNADETVTIRADIDQNKNTITFEVPFGKAELSEFATEGWKLFWTTSNGAVVTYGSSNTTLPKTGTAITGSETYLPEGDSADKFTGGYGEANDSITVKVGDETKEYTVYFKNALPNKASTLGTVELAKGGITNWDDLTDTNHTALTVNNSANPKTLTATIPYGEWADYTTGANGGTLVATLPTGARMYYVSEYSDVLNEITPLNEADTPATAFLPPVDADYYNYGKSDSNYSALVTTGNTPLQIIVVSEAVDETITSGATSVTTITGNAEYNGLYSVYNLTLTQAAPRTTTNIQTFGVYNHDTGYTATATISAGVIRLEVPYYFTDTNRGQNDELYLDFGVTGGETLYAGDTVGGGATELEDVTFDQNGNVPSTIATVSIDMTDPENPQLSINSSAFDKIAVEAEDGTVRATPYSLVVTVAEPNTGAELNSVTIAGVTGRPDADGNVNITVPFGTEVTSLAPTFNVSTNAYVTEGTIAQSSGATIVKEGDTFNFYSARTFTVNSENDAANKKAYTITVTVSDEFVDVTPDDWFYDEVMTAAGNGWINGVGNGRFNPQGTMKRGDFALIIARILEFDEDAYTTSAFPDVASDSYYSAAIAFCADEGIVGGEDGYFNAEDPINREEMAKIICQAAGLEQVTDPANTYADDSSISAWAKGYVYACREAGIMDGVGGNTFSGRRNATRAEAAAVLVRAFA